MKLRYSGHSPVPAGPRGSGRYGDGRKISSLDARFRALELGDLLLFFSYETPIAFCWTDTGVMVERENEWNNTTGRHFTQARMMANKRGAETTVLAGDDFERQLAAIIPVLAR